MLRNEKHIAIITTDKLQIIGLHCLLTDYFPPVIVEAYSDFFEIKDKSVDNIDYFFITPETLVAYADFFLPRKSKTIVMLRRNSDNGKAPTFNFITTESSQETIIEQIEKVLTADNASANISSDANKGLSQREIDVLQLIVKGITNKEIADKLNISLNTVLTHRKNTTAKLVIKTVSGLTFYAIMNGLLSGDEIEL